MANLFALIVGINEYSSSPLSGCVRDAESVKSYLEGPILQSQFEAISVKMLLNNEGTKQNIIDGFRKHLNQAAPGDTVVFYYSGHGGREKTTYKVFQSGEIDNNLGSLICYGFTTKSKEIHQFLLSNKEIRYLIKPLANQSGKPHAHVVTIFDCCHSGSNTRSIEAEEMSAKSRQIMRSALPGRTMDQFLFAEVPALPMALEANTKSLDFLIPQGEHVMLAACREVELAWETSKGPSRGVFTDSLLHVLTQHQGKISYQELHSRVLNRMAFSVSESQGDKGQTPQVYVKTNDASDRFRNFLTHESNSEPAYGVVEYSESGNEWRLALGAFHGLTPNKKNQKVLIYSTGNKEASQSVDVKEVYPFYCTLDLSPDSPLNPQEVYRGEIITLGLKSVAFYLDLSGEQMEAVNSFLTTQLQTVANGKFRLVKSEDQATYVLAGNDGKFVISPPFNRSRPLVKRLGFLDDEGIPDQEILLQLSQMLSKIGQWTLIKTLEYSANPIPDYLQAVTEMYPIEFRLFQWAPDSGTEQQIYANDGTFNLKLEDPKQPLWIRYELINHADQDLNASLAIMTEDFGFLVDDQKNGLKGAVVPLMEAEDAREGHIAYSVPAPSGQSISPKGYPNRHYVPISIDPYFVEFNVPGESVFFKLVASSKPLDSISVFHSSPMGYPKKEDTGSRSFMAAANDDDDLDYPPISWDLKTIEVYVTNPEFKQ